MLSHAIILTKREVGIMYRRRDILPKKYFRPDYIADSITEIDFSYLQKLGIRAVLVDLDGTVVHPRKYEVADSISDVLRSQPLNVFIATNRQNHNLRNLKSQLHAEDVVHSRGVWVKPFARYYKNALSAVRLSPQQVAMIGDRYIQDIYGANRVGITTVLVRRLGRPVNGIDKFISNGEARRTERLVRDYQLIR